MINDENKSKYSNSLSRITEGHLKKMHKQFEQLERWTVDTKKLQEPFDRIAQQAQDLFTPFLEQQKKLQDLGKRISETREQVEAAMRESGWWITPSMMKIPYYFLSRAAKDYFEGNEDAITDLFMKQYQEDGCKNLKDIVSDWPKNKYFKPWSEHLNDALDAHCYEKYTLSVPTLLLISEGIATEFCKDKEIYENRWESKGGKKIKEAVGSYSNESRNLLLSDLDLLETAIDTTIYERTDRIEEKLKTDILNRHAVMHGIKKDYGTCKSSLQAFMLLEVLSELE